MSTRNNRVQDTEPLDEVQSPDFDNAITRLSDLGRAIAAYVEDVRRNLLVAVHEPEGVPVTVDRSHQSQVRRPTRDVTRLN